MLRPIPPGTRDVLPDEMRELRAIQTALLGTFDNAGFSEVRTPTLEYADLMELADRRAADSAYRFFDDRGEMLALRTDMTIPIARLVVANEVPCVVHIVGKVNNVAAEDVVELLLRRPRKLEA